MLLQAVEVRDFRCYHAAKATMGEGLTVVYGPNGAGKSNLLEAICFGLTGRSPRTRNDRELIRFGCGAARVELTLRDRDNIAHRLSVGFGALSEDAGMAKRMRFDGAPLERIADAPGRPLVSVFVPDRLELVNGPPAVRRAHLDHLVAAIWPSRASERADYARALSQRNALIARIRAGRASDASLTAWDLELARHGVVLSSGRAAAVQAISEGFGQRCEQLGLAGRCTVQYRPRSEAQTPEDLAAELRERLPADLERGFTTHGPHRDDFALTRERRQLRAYASQGERRLALLALLLSERSRLAQARMSAPLMLLDDVMSELDESRRRLLVDDLERGDGQSVIATADISSVPGADRASVVRVRVQHGEIAVEPG